MTTSRAPRISILSAVDDDLLDPRGWFAALAGQTLPADEYEILILDASHNTDHEAAYFQFRDEGLIGSNISFHSLPPGGRALALNRGIDLAKSKLIGLLGDDCLPPAIFAEAHVRYHELHPEREAVAVGLALFPEELRTPFNSWLEASGGLWGVPHLVGMNTIPEEFFYVANASIKREFLELAGRWEERFLNHAWDDFEYGERLRALGMKTGFLAEAPVQHLHRVSLDSRERAMKLAGAAARVYETIHPGVYPWSKVLQTEARAHERRIARAELRRRFMRSERARQSWWQRRLDAAFAEGYRQSSPPNGH